MLFLTTQIAVIATGLVAGAFLTFSDFTMRSLAAANSATGTEAMQWINRKVYGSSFLALLLGMAVVSAILLAAGLIKGGASAPWLVVGGAIYLTGVFGVTAIGNVPMNKRLDAMAPGDVETDAYWAVYLRRWTRLNHVRTICSIVAAGAFLVATDYL